MVIIMYYLNNFFLFSILGHLFETIIYLIVGSSKKSGFLYLWWTPFYGIGVVISIYANKYLSNRIKNNFIKHFILFVVHLILFTILEFSGGMLLHLIYKKYFWNYSKIPLHIGKYVSVPTSLFWSLFAFFYLKFIRRFSDKIIERIPKFITIILSIVFIADLVTSLLKVFN